MKGFKAQIQLCNRETPKLFTARSVQFALKLSVKKNRPSYSRGSNRKSGNYIRKNAISIPKMTVSWPKIGKLVKN